MIPVELGNIDSKLKIEKIHPIDQFYFCDRNGTFYDALPDNNLEKVYEFDNNEKGSKRFLLKIAPDFNPFNDSLMIGELSIPSPLSEQSKDNYNIEIKTTQLDKELNREKLFFENKATGISGWIYLNQEQEIEKFGISYKSENRSFNLTQIFAKENGLIGPIQLIFDYQVNHQNFMVIGNTKIQYSNFEIGTQIPNEVYANSTFYLETNYTEKQSTVKKKRRKKPFLIAAKLAE